MRRKSKSIFRMIVAPSPVKDVREALKGTKIPVGKLGTLRILFFDHGTPMGEMHSVPFSVRFEADTLVTYGTWFVQDVRGNPVEVRAAYHYCLRAFKAEMPTDLLELLYTGEIRALLPTEREQVLKALKRYREVEPWLNMGQDTPLMRSLLSLKASRERSFSSLERCLRACTS
jgi:hypothetical protein